MALKKGNGIEGRVNTTTQVNGMQVNDNPSLEKEADILGSKAAG
ncbi:hypothetical protein [Desulfobacula phenolica]|nr:hypothetical protein [Desulfobacula phenolica]